MSAEIIENETKNGAYRSILELMIAPLDLEKDGVHLVAMEFLLSEGIVERYASMPNFGRTLNSFFTIFQFEQEGVFKSIYEENQAINPEVKYQTPYRWYDAVGQELAKVGEKIGKLANHVFSSILGIFGGMVDFWAFVLNPKNIVVVGAGVFVAILALKKLVFGKANANVVEVIGKTAGEAVGIAAKNAIPGGTAIDAAINAGSKAVTNGSLLGSFSTSDLFSKLQMPQKGLS